MPNPNLLSDILQAAGKHKRRQRVGRGEGSKGKTSGTGHKGANSRGGKPMRRGFEGGQTEIYRRFPQRGFSNHLFKTRYSTVNVSLLERFDDGTTIDRELLKTTGLIPNLRLPVKILGDGELTKKLTIKVEGYSRNAYDLIGKAGGEALTADGQGYSFKEPKNERLSRKLDKRLAKLGLPPQEKPADEANLETSASETSVAADVVSKDDDVTKAPESGTEA